MGLPGFPRPVPPRRGLTPEEVWLIDHERDLAAAIDEAGIAAGVLPSPRPLPPIEPPRAAPRWVR